MISYFIKLNDRISTFINQKLSIPNKYPFIMYAEEREILKKYLNKSSYYLEFGLGGSTIFSLIKTNVNVVSVDTNLPWIDFMKKYKIIYENLGKRLSIFYVNIGPTKFWGFPIDDTHKEKFPDFSSNVFEIYNPLKFDTILVDGRFRVACVLQTILNCYENKYLRILVHDYTHRPEYNVIEEFLDIEEFEKLLYVFKIKKDVDLKRVEQLFEEYKYISA